MKVQRENSPSLPFQHYDRWTVLVGAAGFLAAALLILLPAYLRRPFSSARGLELKAGSVAERDFVAGRDIIYTDEEATRLRQEAAKNLVPPVFRLNQELSQRGLSQFDRFQQVLTELIHEDITGEAVFLKVQLSFPGIMSKEEIGKLASYAFAEDLFLQSRRLLEEALGTGLISLPERGQESFFAGALELWRWREGKLEKEELALDRAVTLRTLGGWLAGKLESVSPQRARLVASLVKAFALENCILDRELTEKHRLKAAAEVEPVIARLVKGQVMIRKGDIISEKAASQIKAADNFSASVDFFNIAGTIMFLMLAAGLSVCLLNGQMLKIRLRRSQAAFILGIVLSYLLAATVASRLFQPPAGLPFSVILPTSCAAILTTLIISPNAALVVSLILSLLLLPGARLELNSFLFALLSGIQATAVVYRAEKRLDLIRAGFLLALLNSLVLVTINLLGDYPQRQLLTLLGWGILNGFLSVVVSLGLLPLLEQLLNTATRFKLRELSDLNAPILKRLLNQAPGTYSHSISVANLAETACSEIGADSLLARVASYYHDIGKIDQAEYFIENQSSLNKHDELKPSLSAAVLKSHLKLGVEKAKDLRLPEEVVDIIAQHHGRALIKYFYHRALESDSEGSVASEDYSYPGARPHSREAAVVMLADTVEAASRLLQKPSAAKLEKFVWSLLMEKFAFKELSDSDLTFLDLEVIHRSFVQVLAGAYHSRIEYPKLKELVR